MYFHSHQKNSSKFVYRVFYWLDSNQSYCLGYQMPFVISILYYCFRSKIMFSELVFDSCCGFLFYLSIYFLHIFADIGQSVTIWWDNWGSYSKEEVSSPFFSQCFKVRVRFSTGMQFNMGRKQLSNICTVGNSVCASHLVPLIQKRIPHKNQQGKYDNKKLKHNELFASGIRISAEPCRRMI